MPSDINELLKAGDRLEFLDSWYTVVEVYEEGVAVHADGRPEWVIGFIEWEDFANPYWLTDIVLIDEGDQA